MRRRNAVIVGAAALLLLAAGLAAGALVGPGGTGGGVPPAGSDRAVFHATLADPALYDSGGGVFEDTFETAPGAGSGRYALDFVPSGSSPETLSIAMRGESGFEYANDFVLNGTRHEAGLGEFYTWEYIGENTMLIPDGDAISITVDPNGDTRGSISVYLYREN